MDVVMQSAKRWFSVAAWLTAVLPLAAAAGAQALRMDPQPIEACGGFTGQCSEIEIQGELLLEVDAAMGKAAIPYADLRIGGDRVWPYPGDLDPTRAKGLVTPGGTIELRASERGGSQELEWTLELLGDSTARLRGIYNEGCCDRYTYRFDDVVLRVVPSLERRRLHLEQRALTVEARWTSRSGSGVGHAMPVGDDWGFFWFFRPDNPEIFIKVLASCPGDRSSHWFFASGLTNLGVELTVTDNFLPWRSRQYRSRAGSLFESVADTTSFAERCSTD